MHTDILMLGREKLKSKISGSSVTRCFLRFNHFSCSTLICHKLCDVFFH